jgi:hypothetical protein
MSRFLSFLFPLLIFLYSSVHAITDVYLSSGSATGNYSESTDSQSKELSGTENSLSFRNLESLSFVDLGLDLGTQKLSGDTGTHDADFQSNYANLTAGFSFNLYPSWIEYYLDLGYRFGIGELKVTRTDSDGGKTEYTYNSYTNDSVIKYGVKFVVLGGFLVGMNYENKNGLINKTTQVLNPKIDSSNSLTFSIGYRFGGTLEKTPNKVKSGKRNVNDPCMLFRGSACD